MKRLALGAILATATLASTGFVPANAGQQPLAKVAAQLGYTYAYLGPEDAVELSRPGLVLLVRPGERLFDVNDRTEAMDGDAPHFWRNDVYVSDGFVGRLREIATRYPQPAGDHAIVVQNNSSHVPMGPTIMKGAITELAVSQTPGTQSLGVTGKAPANLPITLTVVGTFSSEIPDVVLNRTKLFAGPDGRFATAVSIAPGYVRGAYLTLIASSVSGIVPASYRLEAKAPNADVSVPAEQQQKSVR